MTHTQSILMDERAFLIFLTDGLRYFQMHAQPTHQGAVMDYCNGLSYRWRQMGEFEKEPYYNQVREQMHNTRHINLAIYQSLLQ